MHPLVRHEPDPDHPGWWTWEVGNNDRFNAAIGKLIVRSDGPGRARCRMFPDARHQNINAVVHGGALLTLIDMTMFAGGHMAGVSNPGGVTLDLSTQFISPAELGQPLDSTIELLRETGRLAFMRGLVLQGDRTVAAWSGTLRKRNP
jgi:acyl-coenzyme A thioesterase PaaI-like protein